MYIKHKYGRDRTILSVNTNIMQKYITLFQLKQMYWWQKYFKNMLLSPNLAGYTSSHKFSFFPFPLALSITIMARSGNSPAANYAFSSCVWTKAARIIWCKIIVVYESISKWLPIYVNILVQNYVWGTTDFNISLWPMTLEWSVGMHPSAMYFK